MSVSKLSKLTKIQEDEKEGLSQYEEEKIESKG